MNILFGKDPLKAKERLETISKYKIHFRNEESNSRCIPFTKEESLKKLKKFFLQTIQGIESRKNDKLEKTHETKLKNML
jgi:hemerythrin